MGERRFIPIKEFIELAPFGRDRCYQLAKTAGFGIRDRNKWFVDMLAYEQWMEAQREGNAEWATSSKERSAATTTPTGRALMANASASRQSTTAGVTSDGPSN